MTLWAKSLDQFNDLAGKPQTTTLQFYVSGTTQPVTVYKDKDFASPHPLEVKSDAFGRLPPIYLKPDGVKLRCDFHTGKLKIRSLDGIDPGAAASAVAPIGAAPLLPAIDKTGASLVITKDDFGGFVSARTATGATVPVLLPKATTLANGQMLGVRNDGDGYAVIRASGVDLIDGGKAVMVGPRESVIIRATGGTFETATRTPPQAIKWVVKSRTVKTGPGGAQAGDTYLAPDDATGWTPTRIYIADGSNGWIAVTPQPGDRAVVMSETVQAGGGTESVSMPLVLQWTGTKWVSENAYAIALVGDQVAAKLTPLTERVKKLEDAKSGTVTLVARNSVTSGTNSLTAQGGTQPVAGTWTRNKLGVMTGTLAGASLTGDLITLPKGKYRVRGRRMAKGQISVAVAFRSTSGGTQITGMPRIADTNQNVVAELDGTVEVTAASEQFELVFLLSGTVGALSLGDAAAIPSVEEVYAEVIIETSPT